MVEMTRRTFLTAAGLSVATIPLLGTRAVFAKEAEAAVTLDVISDVQGDGPDLRDALRDLRSLGTSDALVINGDLVANGTERQYQDLYSWLDTSPRPDRVLAALGNHEQYNSDPFDVQVERFLRYTGMPDVYTRTTIGSLPLVFVGTTKPAKNGTQPPFVTLGSSQLAWLEATLAGYARSPYVLVFSHHVLPGTVSGTTGPDRARFYDQDFVEIDDLLRILGGFPNVVFFSGHTHWDLNRSDWAARKVVAGGHPKGFTVVNTGFVQKMFGPDGNGNEKPLSQAESQGLRVLLITDGELRIESRDFRRNTLIRTLTV
jgi:Icc protein